MQPDAKLLETIIGESCDGFCLTEREGRFVFVNDRFCTLTGYEREALLKMQVRDLMPAGNTGLFLGGVAAGDKGRRRGEIIRRDSTKLPVEVTGNQVAIDGRELVLGIFRDITEIIEAEQKRHASEEIFRTLFEKSNDAIFIHDLQGHFIRLNRKARESFGFPADDDPGRWSVRDIHPESELENAQRHFEQFLQKGVIRFETLLLRQDGSIFPGEVSSSIIHIDGKPLVQGIVRDLSDLKAVEKRYRSLFELSPVSLWEEDLSAVKSLIDGWRREGVKDLRRFLTDHPASLRECALKVKILDVNRAALAMHGAADKDDLLEGLDRIFTEESFTALREEIVALADGDTKVTLEGRVRRFDGTPVDVIVTTFLIPGCEQDWSRAVISQVDITALKNLQRNLEEAQKLANLGSWELNIATGKLWWSSEVYRIFEIDPERFGASYEAFLATVHPDDRQVLDEAFSSHIKKGTPYDLIHRLWFKDDDGTGRIKYVHEKCRTERDAGGRALRALGTVQDVTDQVVAEKEKKKRQQKMEHVQRLESLGVLAGGIAHDFNNLLTAIMGHASMGRNETISPAEVSEHFAAIEETSRRAADLCRQMLAYSGKGRFQVQPVNLSELVESMVRLLEVSLSKRVVVRYDLAKTLPAIEADVTQIQQIIMNLVINANEAIGDRSGSIMITTGLIQVDRAYLETLYLQDDQLTPGPHVFLEVSDTGRGMDAATMEHLFEPFFTTKSTGRGLGMSAVQGIVRGHGGAIKVYSEIDRGTTFKVLFPTVDMPAESFTGGEEATPGIKVSGLVLVVDDEETIRNVAAMILQRAGYKTLTACDGHDAIAKLKQHREEVACVLLDMTMPRMGGEQAYTELVRIKPGLRVILSSGYNEQTATQRLAGKGLAGFIQKPYAPKELLAKVAEILG